MTPERTRQALAYAERHWHMLAELHTATPGPSGIAGRRIDPPTPARLEVIDTGDQLAAEVTEWHQRIPRPMTAADDAARRPQARLRALTRNLPAMLDLEGFPAWAARTRDTIAAHIGDKAPGRTWTCLCGTMMRVRAWLPVEQLTDTGPTTTCPGCGTAWDKATILDAADPEGACTCLPPWGYRPALRRMRPLRPQSRRVRCGIPVTASRVAGSAHASTGWQGATSAIRSTPTEPPRGGTA